MEYKYKFITSHRKFQGIESWHGWHMETWQGFVEYFNNNSPNKMKIEWAHPHMDKYKDYTYGMILNQQAIIENIETEEFWVINWQDMQGVESARYKKFLKDPKLKNIVRIMYNIEENYDDKVRPWVYFPKNPEYLENQIDELRKLPKIIPKLSFRGDRSYGRGKILRELAKYDKIFDNNEDILPQDEYLKELASTKVALCLRGRAKACHREIECMAVGTVVLQPLYKNYYLDPLIPYKHYIPIETSKNPGPDEMAKAIKETHERVIKNRQYLDKVRINASKWYDKNVRRPDCFRTLKEILEI